MILGLGSNFGKEKNMAEAVSRLSEHFPDICFSVPVLTEPIGECGSDEWFLNCVAVGTTQADIETVRHWLKAIERALGRTVEEKAAGRISIDIDLLQWNAAVLKPHDLARDYIMAGLTSLASLPDEA